LRQDREAEIEKRIDYTRFLVHELKTPLTPMVTSSQLLIEELPEGPLRKAVAVLAKGTSDLDKRIDELLDLAKAEVGTLRVSPEEVDMMGLLHGVADSVATVFAGRGQSLVLDISSSLSPVWADEQRLQQVLLNLLSNASKFTPAGGSITLRVREHHDVVIVEVQDNGIGINEEEQQLVFDPYYRGRSDSDRLSGLGLGLALCKILIELHGGQIWVNSRLGEGSTFGFSIPLESAHWKDEP
jgi:two-component system clock-associated histidine kinase SasA